MRIQFDFKMTQIPRAYRLGILSIIKEMIRKGSEEFYEDFFIKNRQKMKAFSHSSYIQNLEIKDDTIIGDRLILTISSPSYEFIMHLMNGSERSNQYIYQGYELELRNKRLLPNPPKLSSIVTFKTLSPILIEDRNQQPLLDTDEQFEQEFNYYANLQLKELYNRPLHEQIYILQSSMKKVVLQENLHQSQTNPVFITANQGLLQLKGHPNDLRAIYDLGIGRRRSLGLGLLNIEEVIYQ